MSDFNSFWVAASCAVFVAVMIVYAWLKMICEVFCELITIIIFCFCFVSVRSISAKKCRLPTSLTCSVLPEKLKKKHLFYLSLFELEWPLPPSVPATFVYFTFAHLECSHDVIALKAESWFFISEWTRIAKVTNQLTHPLASLRLH